MYILIMAVAVILIAVIVWKSLKMKPLDTTYPSADSEDTHVQSEGDDVSDGGTADTAENADEADEADVSSGDN